MDNTKKSLENFTIDEIVEELSKRKGVEIDKLASCSGMNLDVEGPAIMIVIDK